MKKQNQALSCIECQHELIHQMPYSTTFASNDVHLFLQACCRAFISEMLGNKRNYHALMLFIHHEPLKCRILTLISFGMLNGVFSIACLCFWWMNIGEIRQIQLGLNKWMVSATIMKTSLALLMTTYPIFLYVVQNQRHDTT